MIDGGLSDAQREKWHRISMNGLSSTHSGLVQGEKGILYWDALIDSSPDLKIVK